MSEYADKTASVLHDDRFQMLESIAQELNSDVTFPTCFDVAIRVGDLLKRDDVGVPEIANEVQKDPLITAKLLKVANSAAFNATGRSLVEVGQAITRIGMRMTRTIALACAMQQLAASRQLAEFEALSRSWWEHSLKTAAIARFLAQQQTRFDPDLALLAGLTHDLGAFYMLERAARYPELQERPQTVAFLVAQWHESVTTLLLDALGLPDEVVDAARDSDAPRKVAFPLRSLSDLVYVANVFSGGVEEMKMLDLPRQPQPDELEDARYLEMKPAMDAAVAEFMAGW
ncbi:HDOD domain-containing protein [Chitinibacteraceae bacterium HSL-7]